MKKSIMQTLESNMAYVPGEKVAIICQDWNSGLGKDAKTRMEESKKCAEKMFEVYQEENVDVELLRYTPEKARNGVTPHKNYTTKLNRKDHST